MSKIIGTGRMVIEATKGEIIKYFGVKDKKIHISKTEAETFYKVHQAKPFYNDLCSYFIYLTSFHLIISSYI